MQEPVCNLAFLWAEGNVPDYLVDLNAMHEAYCEILTKRLGPYGAIDATASQRAEAFLRTIGKWQDGDPTP